MSTAGIFNKDLNNIPINNRRSYPDLDIANTLINLAIQNGKPLTQISVLTLLYFMNASYLVVNKVPLINEKFEAWNFGPMLRKLYVNNLSKHDSLPISKPLTENKNINLDNDIEAQQVIKTIYENHGDMPPSRLVNKTKKKNGAWFNTYCNEPYSEISNEEIIREFTPFVVGVNE